LVLITGLRIIEKDEPDRHTSGRQLDVEQKANHYCGLGTIARNERRLWLRLPGAVASAMMGSSQNTSRALLNVLACRRHRVADAARTDAQRPERRNGGGS
jgi:hypothetical protein